MTQEMSGKINSLLHYCGRTSLVECMNEQAIMHIQTTVHLVGYHVRKYDQCCCYKSSAIKSYAKLFQLFKYHSFLLPISITFLLEIFVTRGLEKRVEN